MSISQLIAKHLRDVHFGGNWTFSSMKEHLAGIDWKQATQKIEGFNTIATLVYHTNYFVAAQLDVLEGKPLTAKDEFSFSHPPIESEEDWQNFLEETFRNVEKAAALIEQLPDEKLLDNFTDPKYGTWYRNLQGAIEHTHYHLGQLVIVKKLVLASAN